MTLEQRRARLRRIDLFLCWLFGIKPGPDPYPPKTTYIVRFSLD